MISLTCGSKNDANELIYKIEIDSQTQKTNLWLPKGKGEEGINKEFGIKIYILLDTKQITNKGLLYKTGNYTQCLVITYHGKESLCYTLKLTQHWKSTPFLSFFFFLSFCLFQGHTHSIWRFPGQGSNWSCSCWPTPEPQQLGIRVVSATYTTAHGNA